MAKLLEIARLLTIGPKKAVPKRKRKILKEASKKIEHLESTKTERTKMIEKATGRPSDIEKKKKEVARRARQTLIGAGRK